MKKLIIFLMLTTISIFCFAEGFQGFEWRTPKDLIIKEKGTTTEITNAGETQYLIYSTKINDHPYKMGFGFIADKLTSGRLVYDETILVNEQYILEYNEVEKLLTEKYGQPKETNKINLTNDNSISGVSFALRFGRGLYSTQWIKEDTSIILICYGSKGTSTLMITYNNPEKEPREQKQTKEDSINNL